MAKKTAKTKAEEVNKNKKSTAKKKNGKTDYVTELIRKSNRKAPESVQDSIPYYRLYEDTNTNGGIIESEKGLFTKSYIIADTNYSDAGEDRQEEILGVFEKILNSFNVGAHYQITLNNRTYDPEEFNKRALIEYRNDEFDTLRAQHNDLIREKMQEGKNNVRVEKYFTVGIEAEDIKEAMTKFVDIERELSLKLKNINSRGLDGMILSLKERLEILHDLYNIGQEGTFSDKFDINDVISQGIRAKDIIAPTYMNFVKNDCIQIDDKYARVMFLKAIPGSLNSALLENLTKVATNLIISVHYDIQAQDKAVSFASAEVTNIGGDVVKAQKVLTKSGASGELISPRLATAHSDAKMLLEQLSNGSESLFHVTVIATIFADNIEDLDLYTEQFKTRARDCLCTVDILRAQQEPGFNSCLPLANNSIKAHRILPTKAAAAIQPFSTQELQIKGGFYYGNNQTSKNLILYNRNNANNQNGVILGPPGTGKSFAAKMEMYQAYLNTQNSQIFIIDPEREYKVLGERLNATIIRIQPDSSGQGNYLNPLDLNLTPSDDGDPVAEKIDFVISIVETMCGHGELTGYLKSIIDNTLQQLYAPYRAALAARGEYIDTELCPTLYDFYMALKSRREPEALNLAQSIQIYCAGSQNLFAHHTNINTENRMVIYDTKNIGTNLKELGMQVCLNDIWQRMMANKGRGIRTYFYIDEFYLLLRQLSAAKYLEMIWKRARKWMGSPTGITQNISDLLNSEEGNSILKTSDFALILAQSFEDRIALSQIYRISEEQQQYIANTTASGEGLIYTSKSIVPFENHVPETSPIYKLLTTKPDDSEGAIVQTR